MPVLALAVGLSYLGSTMRNVATTSRQGAVEGQSWPEVAGGNLGVAVCLAGAGSISLIVWGCLAALPNVSAALLGQWPYDLVGTRTQPLFSRLVEAKHLIAGIWLLLVFTTRLPPAMGLSGGVNYAPMVKGAGLSLAACVTWLIGAELAPLGHGYALLGAIFSTGLFTLALARLARYFTSAAPEPLDQVARWLARSSPRAFFLGASLATYGLLFRPLFYDLLWFAPVFEWLVVLTFAVIAIVRTRSRIKGELTNAAAPVAEWPNWSRHVQTTEEKRDPRMDWLLGYQRSFVDTGQSRGVWGYLLALMLRNQVPLGPITQVLQPLRSCFLASNRFDPWPGKPRRLKRRRERALMDAFGLAATALAHPLRGPEEVDETRSREVGERFVERGADPTELAVVLATAYWRNGADLDKAIDLWFPLMSLVDRPRVNLLKRVARGEYRLLNFRRRYRVWDREQRMIIVDGAASHLFGEGTIDNLTVAILNEEVRVDDYFSPFYLWRLLPGEPVEVWENAWGRRWLRPGDGLRFYAASTDIKRQPVLPKDYAVAERELMTA